MTFKGLVISLILLAIPFICVAAEKTTLAKVKILKGVNVHFSIDSVKSSNVLLSPYMVAVYNNKSNILSVTLE